MTLTSAVGAPGAPGNLRMTPGRWVAVGLAVPVAIALIGWTGFTLVTTIAHGSYPFSYPVQVRGGQVAVNVSEGNITLRPASGGAARLTGTVQYGLVRPDITESTTATGTSLANHCDGIASECGIDATLVVPARTGVSLWTGGGDINVSGFTSPMTLWAQGGNMTASNLAGDLRLDTGGGDLTGSGLTGTIQISTEGGNVEASNSSGVMRLNTGGGDLSGDGISGGSVQVVTGGGNIDLAAMSSPQVTADSGGGDVTLAFTAVPTNLQITADGGNVTVILPPGGTTYDILARGGGGNVSYSGVPVSSTSPNTITVSSGGGDITITQAS